MRVLFLAVALGLGLVPAVAPAAPSEGLRGPLVQLVTRDSAVIRWFTPKIARGVVHYGVEPLRLTATVAEPTARQDHEVRLKGLKGATTYYYAVLAGDAVAAGSDQHFATAPGPCEPFRFVVFGDSRGPANSCESSPAWRSVARMVAGLKPAMVIGTGDYVANGGRPECWDKWIEGSGSLFRHTPFFPAIGNHEYDRQFYTGEHNSGLVNFSRWFALPPGPDAAVRTSYYAFTFGNSRFIVYDDYKDRGPGSAQLRWLERELTAARANPDIQHVFVVNHTTFEGVGSFCRPDESDRNQSRNREWVEPLLERHAIDATFAGHEHSYARVVKNGITHVVTGGAGAPLERGEGRCEQPTCADNPGLVRFNGCRHHAVLVEVDGPRVTYTALADDGTTRLDAWQAEHWPAKAARCMVEARGGKAPAPAAPKVTPPPAPAATPPSVAPPHSAAVHGRAARLAGLTAAFLAFGMMLGRRRRRD
ncbi:MAG TPA: metallophosphoesterase [Polyangia bacterium]